MHVLHVPFHWICWRQTHQFLLRLSCRCGDIEASFCSCLHYDVSLRLSLRWIVRVCVCVVLASMRHLPQKLCFNWCADSIQSGATCSVSWRSLDGRILFTYQHYLKEPHCSDVRMRYSYLFVTLSMMSTFVGFLPSCFQPWGIKTLEGQVNTISCQHKQ